MKKKRGSHLSRSLTRISALLKLKNTERREEGRRRNLSLGSFPPHFSPLETNLLKSVPLVVGILFGNNNTNREISF
jgi:hypothetical protein